MNEPQETINEINELLQENDVIDEESYEVTTSKEFEFLPDNDVIIKVDDENMRDIVIETLEQKGIPASYSYTTDNNFDKIKEYVVRLLP